MTPSAAPESTARPRAAARPARVFAQGRFETLTLLRNGEQLLVSVVLPAMALVGLTLSPYPALGDVHRIDVTAPGVLALAVASTAFTGQAISTAFDRRYGVLRMYGVSPLGRSGLLMGKLIAVGAVLLVQVLLLGGLALALGCEHGGEEGFCTAADALHTARVRLDPAIRDGPILERHGGPASAIIEHVQERLCASPATDSGDDLRAVAAPGVRPVQVLLVLGQTDLVVV